MTNHGKNMNVTGNLLIKPQALLRRHSVLLFTNWSSTILLFLPQYGKYKRKDLPDVFPGRIVNSGRTII